MGAQGVRVGEVAGADQDVPLVPLLGLHRQLPPLPLLKHFFDSLPLEIKLTSSFQVLSLRCTSFSLNPLHDPPSPGKKIKQSESGNQHVVSVSIDITLIVASEIHRILRV